jgi:hypothetical protein
MNTSKFRKSGFSNAPEVLDAVDVGRTGRGFIFAMMDAIVLFIAKVHQAIVGFEPIGIDDRIETNPILDNRHQRLYRAVFNDLGIDFTLPLDQPENNDLAFGSPAPDVVRPARSEKLSLISTSPRYGLSISQHSAIRWRTARRMRLIELRLRPVRTAILDVSISKEMYFIMVLNLASEIFERKMYLLFIARQYVSGYVNSLKLSWT